MNMHMFWTALVSLLSVISWAGLGQGAPPAEKLPDTTGPAKIRVLIDGSKVGGSSWIRTEANGAATIIGQGEVLVDLLRNKGYEVIVLSRRDTVSAETLKDIDAIIRPRFFFPYTVEEAAAYRDAVSNGLRLLLFGQSRMRVDPIAQEMGLAFDLTQRIGPVSRQRIHTVTNAVSEIAGPWVEAVKMPAETVGLAWCGKDRPEANPVMGYFRHGKGSVVFLGADILMGDRILDSAEIVECLLNSPVDSTTEQLQNATLTVVDRSGPKPPRLIAPTDQVRFSQDPGTVWRFEWEPVPNARSYHVVAFGGLAHVPFVDQTTATPMYSYRRSGSGYIAPHNCLNWTWQVKCQDATGNWGEWSEPGHFAISPPQRVSAKPPGPPVKKPPPEKRSIRTMVKDLERYEKVEVVTETAKVKTGQDVVALAKKGDRFFVLRRDGPWIGVAISTPDGECYGWLLASCVRSLLPVGFDSERAPPEISAMVDVLVNHTQFPYGREPGEVCVCFELSLKNNGTEPLAFDPSTVQLRVGAESLKMIQEEQPAPLGPIGLMRPSGPTPSPRPLRVLVPDRSFMQRELRDVPRWKPDTTIAPGESMSGWLAFEVPRTLDPSRVPADDANDPNWILTIPFAAETKQLDLSESENAVAVQTRFSGFDPSVTVVEFGSRINGLNVNKVLKTFEDLCSGGHDCVVLCKDHSLFVDVLARSRLQTARMQPVWAKLNSAWVNPSYTRFRPSEFGREYFQEVATEAEGIVYLLSKRSDGWRSILQLLEDPAMEAKRAAAYALAEHMHRPGVLQALMQLISDQDALVRMAAVNTIIRAVTSNPRSMSFRPRHAAGRLALEGQVLEVLLNAATAESPGVRSAAVLALQNSQDPRATEAIVQALGATDQSVRLAAVTAAATRPAEKVTPMLLAELDGEDEQIVLAACQSLAKLKNEACIPRMRALLESRNSTTWMSAITALKDLGELTASEAGLLRLQRGASLQSGEKEALVEAKDPQSIAKLNEVMLKSVNSQTANTAACLLAEMGEQSALEPLLRQLASGAQIDFNVTRALGKLGDERAVEPLKKILDNRRDSARTLILEALLMLKAPGVREQILDEIESPPQRYQIPGLLRVLRQVEGDAAIEIIEPFLDNEQHHVSTTTLLWDLGTPEAIAAIRQRLMAEDYPYSTAVIRSVVECAARLAQTAQQDSQDEQFEKLTEFLRAVGRSKNVATQTAALEQLAEIAPDEDTSRP
jgi:HEAT repeat protein